MNEEHRGSGAKPSLDLRQRPFKFKPGESFHPHVGSGLVCLPSAHGSRPAALHQDSAGGGGAKALGGGGLDRGRGVRLLPQLPLCPWVPRGHCARLKDCAGVSAPHGRGCGTHRCRGEGQARLFHSPVFLRLGPLSGFYASLY